MTTRWLASIAVIAMAVCAGAAAQDRADWRAHVPAADKSRTNPRTATADVGAGARLYDQHCSRCHGVHAEGHGRKPALTGADITGSADGELFWLLKNGEIGRGMPAWTNLPEEQRWQMISYIRSLSTTPSQGEKK